MTKTLQFQSSTRIGAALFQGALLLSSSTVAACASTQAPTQVNDPASATAPTAAPHEGSSVLTHNDGTLGESPDTSGDSHQHHGHGAGTDIPASTSSGHDHSAHGHSPSGATSTEDEKGESPAGAVYTCPMHPEVRSSQAGRCPKCGMNLERTNPEKSAE